MVTQAIMVAKADMAVMVDIGIMVAEVTEVTVAIMDMDMDMAIGIRLFASTRSTMWQNLNNDAGFIVSPPLLQL
jgi:hypothetical protein